jgi:hypothetical protein
MRHLVPCRTNIDTSGLANLFIEHIWRYHGLPETIISDRGSVLASQFWKFVCHRLGIELKFSTPFHLEIDGQTECINGVMEQYLRCYVNYLQDDWSNWLPLAEFAANNQASETTGISPFFAVYGCDPRSNFNQAIMKNPENFNEREAEKLAQKMVEIHEHTRLEIGRAQLRYQEQADRHRLPAPKFQIGDKVWLDARNISTTRPSRKLDDRRLGPYEIIQIISPQAYKLALPEI